MRHDTIASDFSEENMKRLVADMKKLYPRATIPLNEYESLIPVMTCHGKDRHVLAAAVSKGVDVIVTRDIDDFPPESLAPYAIETQSADEFVSHVLDLSPTLFLRYFRKRGEQRRFWALKNGKPSRRWAQISSSAFTISLCFDKATGQISLTWLTRRDYPGA
jgi:hypothetical protein